MSIIAYDLGTGGVKASLYNDALHTVVKTFVSYDTYYPEPGFHEQRPADWWQGIVTSTRLLLEKSGLSYKKIKCLSLSGHSLVSVPIDKSGNTLLSQVPIWSDTRAKDEAKEFFSRIDEADWYNTTGSGFPSACYSLFKLMWMKKHQPEVFSKAAVFLGSKDYINFRLTGRCCTDPSYASGTGAYNLIERKMQARFLDAAEISPSLFPDIVSSHTIIGNLTKEAAKELGLTEDVSVACGGVDNACMALGAVGAEEGKAYISLGSSSWIPVNSKAPILDNRKKPYVFAHIEEGMYTSAFSIFSGGNSLRWIRDTICQTSKEKETPFEEIIKEAATSPPGANGIIFNPSLAGGTSQDKSVHIRGAYLGLGLEHTKADLLRAGLEGITLNLKVSYDFMRLHAPLSNELLICGGGSKSAFWMQMFADIFETTIIKSNIDQDAASLGAAAIAARAMGIWQDYHLIKTLHMAEYKYRPQNENGELYRSMQKTFCYIAGLLADIGDYMQQT